MNQPSTRPTPLTIEQVKAKFDQDGLSVVEWARSHKVSPSLVYNILGGDSRRRCKRGQSHKIAVLLGLKVGNLGAGA